MDGLGKAFAAVWSTENKLTYACLTVLSSVCGWPEPVQREEEWRNARRRGPKNEQSASGREEQPEGVYNSPQTRREATAVFQLLRGQLNHPDAVEKALLQMTDSALLECFRDSKEETLRKLRLFDKDPAAASSPSTSKTPPSKYFAAWLIENKPSAPLSHEEALNFVEKAPITSANKDFLRENLRAVPEVRQGQLNCPVKLHTVFPRPDFVAMFVTLYIRAVHVCIAQGLRRYGKSVSILEAVLTARAKNRAGRDKVVFFWDGTGNRPGNFKTIFALLNCMGIPAIIDEFQEHPEVAQDLKGFVEAPGLGCPESPLQFVFYGSNQEKVIHQKEKWINAIDGAGVKVAAVTLPPAPIGLLRAIMRHNRQDPPQDVSSPERLPGAQHMAPRSRPAATARHIHFAEDPRLPEEQPATAEQATDVDESLAEILTRACPEETFRDEGASSKSGAIAADEKSELGPEPVAAEASVSGSGGQAGEGGLKGIFAKDEEAMTLLRRTTLAGFDLKLHHREAIPPVGQFAQTSMTALVYSEGRNEGVLRRLLDVSNQLSNADQEVVRALVDAGLIRTAPTGGKYEFVEPRLLSLSMLRKYKYDAERLESELENVEGKVFEKLVQSDPDLGGALFRVLRINQNELSHDTYGTLSKDTATGGAEIDRLLYETNSHTLTIVSAKRDRRQQNLNGSFLNHIEKACENLSSPLDAILPHVRKLRLVAVSVRSRGAPFSLGPPPPAKKSSRLRFDEKSDTFLLDVVLKKSSEIVGSGQRLTWEVEAHDLTFSALLEMIPTNYPACTAVLVT